MRYARAPCLGYELKTGVRTVYSASTFCGVIPGYSREWNKRGGTFTNYWIFLSGKRLFRAIFANFSPFCPFLPPPFISNPPNYFILHSRRSQCYLNCRLNVWYVAHNTNITIQNTHYSICIELQEYNRPYWTSVWHVHCAYALLHVCINCNL